jgi:hypothetical protein
MAKKKIEKNPVVKFPRLGKLPQKVDPRTLKLARYLKHDTLPSPPVQAYYGPAVIQTLRHAIPGLPEESCALWFCSDDKKRVHIYRELDVAGGSAEDVAFRPAGV